MPNIPEKETTEVAATVSEQAADQLSAPQQPVVKEDIRSPFPLAPAQAHDIKKEVAQILGNVTLPERRMLGSDPGPATSPSSPSTPPNIGTPLSASTPAPDDQSDSTSSSLVVALRTLRNDMQKIVRIDKMSLVHAASLEQKRASDKKKVEERKPTAPNPGTQQRRHRTLGVLFASLILLTLGGAALGSVIYVATQRRPQNIATSQNSLLFAEQTIPLSLSEPSPSNIKQHIVEMRKTPVGSLGSITRISPVAGVVTADGTASSRAVTVHEFFQALGAKPPDELLRALGDDFFFGTHTIDTNASILVFNVLSYERAFSGMLAWESTMNTDLSPIFATVSPYTLGTDGIPRDRRFTDTVMRNYDVRILKDDRGATIMYYSFPAPNLLIIAESPYSFPEILTRLRAQRRL